MNKQLGLNLDIAEELPQLREEWKEMLKDTVLYKTDKIDKEIKELRKDRVIYPKDKQVFRAFYLHPKDIKVVILGQDPYHNGNANGLAFGCNNTISPSLSNILISIQNNLGKKSTKKHNNKIKSLSHLNAQGVMLLNTSLTVEEGKPNSHANYGWSDFVANTLSEFSKKYPKRVYMLWGNKAQQYTKFIDCDNNFVLKATHPAHAAYNDRSWDCKHFTLANEYLINNDKKPIQWL